MGLFSRRPKKQSITNEELSHNLDGLDVALTLRHNPRAKRISLKLNRAGNGLILVFPRKADRAQALEFLDRQSQWATQHLDRIPAPVRFDVGVVIPYLGVDYEICHDPNKRFGVTFSDGKIWIAGPPEHLERRLRDYIKKQAKIEITKLAISKADRLDKKLGRITIRDQRTRWGSCASSGNLSFSWRLMLAPATILDYVVGHEVAHLVEMNHSKAFWDVVDKVVENPQKSRRWLKENGSTLHRIG